MKVRVIVLAVAVGAAVTLTLIGCGYHTARSASALPQNVRTVAIPGFVSHSQTFRVEQLLTDAVVREFNARTQYHVCLLYTSNVAQLRLCKIRCCRIRKTP